MASPARTELITGGAPSQLAIAATGTKTREAVFSNPILRGSSGSIPSRFPLVDSSCLHLIMTPIHTARNRNASQSGRAFPPCLPIEFSSVKDEEAKIMAGSLMEFTDANWKSEVLESRSR